MKEHRSMNQEAPDVAELKQRLEHKTSEETKLLLVQVEKFSAAATTLEDQAAHLRNHQVPLSELAFSVAYHLKGVLHAVADLQDIVASAAACSAEQSMYRALTNVSTHKEHCQPKMEEREREEEG